MPEWKHHAQTALESLKVVTGNVFSDGQAYRNLMDARREINLALEALDYVVLDEMHEDSL